MRVASYNIRKAVGLDWRRDPLRVLDVLDEMDADVVVLQEADKRIGGRAGVLPEGPLAARGYRIADLSLRPHSHGWHGNAVLYRPAAVQIVQTTRIDLPSLEPRGAVSVRLMHPDIEVIDVHLGLTWRSRMAQLRALGRYLRGAEHPVLIAGDFNIWRADAGISDALGGGCEVILAGNSFHAAREIAPLDRFVLRGAVRHKSAWVHRSRLAAQASDHLPIVIDLEFPQGAK
jgi:endonuclease/exonuclease/phosphatase family metal-dependent hydrolase